MNSGLNEIEEEKQTLFRRPPQVKSSKAQIQAEYHKIPTIRFEDQKLTSFSGLLIFQGLLGLRKLPDVSTISRALSQMEYEDVDKHRELSRCLVIEGLIRERLPRLTFDFDGSVLSTKGHAEGTAVGFNKAKKGARSYYPLFCTVAQTGQFFDVLHGAGTIGTISIFCPLFHDSNIPSFHVGGHPVSLKAT